jgi:predicted DNA-binding protein (MmcQ/YjbR family)
MEENELKRAVKRTEPKLEDFDEGWKRGVSTVLEKSYMVSGSTKDSKLEFICAMCGFTSNHERGIKVHIGRMHK